MSLIGRYILRQAFIAFAASLTTLTGIVWLTQVLREIDVITTQGQTFATFLTMTILALPAFTSVIAPVALFIAIVHTLNRLHADSELIVINAAGLARHHVFAPFLALAALVAVFVTVTNVFLMPLSLSTLRVMITEARADLISHVLQPGRFSTPEPGLTFHIRERTPRGELRGLLVTDEREKTQQLTYIAETGRIVTNREGSFLVMENGNVQRQRRSQPNDIQIVRFDRYLVDIAQLALSASKEVFYKPRERSIAYLLNPDPNDPHYAFDAGRFRSELHQRLSSPLLPFALAFIALAFLGGARTTRERGEFAVGLAIVSAVAIEIALFGAINLTRKEAWATGLIYGIPLAVIAYSTAAAFGLLKLPTGRLYAAYAGFLARLRQTQWLQTALARYGRTS